MTDFTTIVRPNQTPDIRPVLGRQLRSAPPPVAEVVDPDEGFTVWGSSGNDAFQLRANVKSQIDPPKDEESRKFTTVRIENPDDSDQYIETEVMTEYQARNQIDKKQFTLRFAEPEASDNVKILKKDQTRTVSS